MAIEVRSLIITSTVGPAATPADRSESPAWASHARLKAELMEECRIWLQELLRRQQER